MNSGRIVAAACIAALWLVALSPLSGAAQAAGGDFAPENIEKTETTYNRICWLRALCPVSDDMRALIRRAIEGKPASEYLLSLKLLVGKELPMDRDAGIAWSARAAEHGDPDAARDIASRLRNGASIKVDETKIANALKPQVDAGNTEAMRALAPMIIRGRGTRQDPAAGLAMLMAAAQKGSSGAEQDLAQLYLNGAPGLPANRPEALRWLTVSAGHGNIDAMTSLGYMSMTSPVGGPYGQRDLSIAYCWLVRAAQLDQKQAQDKLVSIFVNGEKDDRGNVIAVDLMQADVWFRIAARSPFHDNPQYRAAIEPNLTTEQLNEAKRQSDVWQPLKLEDLKLLAIPLPFSSGTKGNCPPMG